MSSKLNVEREEKQFPECRKNQIVGFKLASRLQTVGLPLHKPRALHNFSMRREEKMNGKGKNKRKMANDFACFVAATIDATFCGPARYRKLQTRKYCMFWIWKSIYTYIWTLKWRKRRNRVQIRAQKWNAWFCCVKTTSCSIYLLQDFPIYCGTWLFLRSKCMFIRLMPGKSKNPAAV